MKAFTSLDMQQRTGDVQRAAGVAPVLILSHGKPRNVVMSVEEFERLKTKAGEPVQIPIHLAQARVVGPPTDLLGYDTSDFASAVGRMIDDVKSGRTAVAVDRELAAVRRRYRGGSAT